MFFTQILPFISFALAICSCNNNTSVVYSKIESPPLDSSKLVATSLLENVQGCTPSYLDTSTEMFAIHYVGKEKYYTIDLTIKKISKELNCQFNCSDPRSIVPRFKSYYDSTICLARGCGDHCEVYYIIRLTNDSIFSYRSFEYAFDIDLINSYCVIINQENYSEILVVDFIKEKCFSKQLLTGKLSSDILDLNLEYPEVFILYEDSSQQEIIFSKTDIIQPLSNYPMETIPIGPTRK